MAAQLGGRDCGEGFNLNQQTIRTTASVSGPLLHAPGNATVTFSPAPEDTGRIFVRDDLLGHPQVLCRPENSDVRYRWTTIRQDGVSISVIDHALAACQGLKIDNLFISVDADGIPVPDSGSARPFVDALLSAGIVYQTKQQNFLVIDQPVFISDFSDNPKTGEVSLNKSYIIALPGDKFEVAYVLEYPSTFLGTQIVKFDVYKDFVQEIAPARSFITSWELDRLRDTFGPAIDETLVVYPDCDCPQRLPLEAARHKALDLIGDLGLLDRPIKGTVIGIRSGHKLNRKLVLELAHQAA